MYLPRHIQCALNIQHPFTEDSTLLEYSVMFWRSLLPPSSVQSWNINLYGIISRKLILNSITVMTSNLFQCKAINSTTVMSYLYNYSRIFNAFHSSKFVLVLSTVNYYDFLHLRLNAITVWWIVNIFQTILFYSKWYERPSYLWIIHSNKHCRSCKIGAKILLEKKTTEDTNRLRCEALWLGN